MRTRWSRRRFHEGDAVEALAEYFLRVDAEVRGEDLLIHRAEVDRVREIAELIVTGTGVKVLHVTLGGFDTHYTELNRHDALMNYLDSAITAFHDDLTAYGMADRVMIATWSEFGRRPKENASGGTDHGTASPIFLIGDGVKGGLYGETPNLSKLDQLGNLSYAVDFRAVYQEILASHLGVDAKEILGQSFDRVPFVKAAA